MAFFSLSEHVFVLIFFLPLFMTFYQQNKNRVTFFVFFFRRAEFCEKH